MNQSLFLRIRVIGLMQIAAATCACLCVVSTELSAQTPFLEFRYEFDTEEAPLVDSTGQNANLGLGSNGIAHRFGEASLVGGDGFSIGLDAPGVGHPTGSYLGVLNAPHPETFSYSIWIKPLLTGTTQAILARDNVWWPSPCNYYCLYIDNFQSIMWKTGGIETILTEEGIIEEGETYHLVVTHLDSDGEDTGSADRSRIYLNGEMVGEMEDPNEIPSLDSIADGNGIFEDLWVGTLSSFGGYWGEMDDFQFYSTELSPEQIAEMYANPGSLADFGGVNDPGDYNGNGELDAGDLDLQAEVMTGGPGGPEYDLNGDDVVDYTDREIWINDLKNTWIGDANLNGEFNSGDMVQVFARGKYEKQETAGWADGDWNGDTLFGSSDMVAAFVAGGYEKGLKPGGPKPAVSAVPEPSSMVLILMGMAGLLGMARHHKGSGDVRIC